MNAAISTLALIFLAAPADDRVAEKLSEAKETYRKSMEKAREPILRRFEDADSKARDAGDVNLVDDLKKERAAFEGESIIPKRFSTVERGKSAEKARKSMLAAYRDSANRAKDAMTEAYQKAIKDYLAAKDDVAAKRIKAEMDDFRKNPFLTSKDQTARILGSWRIMSMIADGKELRNIEAENLVLTFGKNRYFVSKGGQVMHAGTWTADSSKEPLQVVQVVQEGRGIGMLFNGIYKWDGDDLIQCSGPTFPDKFESLPGQKHQLARLRRVAP